MKDKSTLFALMAILFLTPCNSFAIDLNQVGAGGAESPEMSPPGFDDCKLCFTVSCGHASGSTRSCISAADSAQCVAWQEACSQSGTGGPSGTAPCVNPADYKPPTCSGMLPLSITYDCDLCPGIPPEISHSEGIVGGV